MHVYISVQPEGGKANQGVVSLLAERPGVAKSNVTIVRGHTSRQKVVAIAGLGTEDVLRRLAREGSG